MRYILPISLLILLIINCSTQSNQKVPKNSKVTDYSHVISQTEKKINRLIKKNHLPGFAICLIDSIDVIHTKTYGYQDLENNIETSAETVFKLWSVAKTLTAIEIFRAVEDGLIDLDLTLESYLPDFKIKNRFPGQSLITIRSMLAHRSGLPRNECVLEKDSMHIPGYLDKFEKAMADCYLAFPTGFRYKYSNVGYDLLGRVIEEVRDEGFLIHMNKNLLEPLGMSSGSFYTETIDNSRIAKGYEFYKGIQYPLDQTMNINSFPSGNLYSSIEDLAIFLIAVINNNNLFKEPQTLPAMFVDHYSNAIDPETMGLGWKTSIVLGSELLVWHDGGPDDGTGALIAFLPERKLGIALASNSTAFGGNLSVPLAAEILEEMLEIKQHPKEEVRVKEKRIKVEPTELNKFTGKYVTFGEVMDIRQKGDKLKGKISGIELDLIPVTDTSFKVSHWMHRIGLTKIIKPPIDFNKLQIEFFHGSPLDSNLMIINLDNISHEYCPGYPYYDFIPHDWNRVIGNYRMADRLKENKAGKLTDNYFNIYQEGNVLKMSGPFGAVLPIDKNYIRIIGGPFDGETMEYGDSSHIIHQNAVFIPVK